MQQVLPAGQSLPSGHTTTSEGISIIEIVVQLLRNRNGNGNLLNYLLTSAVEILWLVSWTSGALVLIQLTP